MSDEKPWDVTDDEYKEQMKQAEEWWTSASPADRRKLWDKICEQFSCPIMDNMSQMAEMFFYQMFRRFPNCPVEEKS